MKLKQRVFLSAVAFSSLTLIVCSLYWYDTKIALTESENSPETEGYGFKLVKDRRFLKYKGSSRNVSVMDSDMAMEAKISTGDVLHFPVGGTQVRRNRERNYIRDCDVSGGDSREQFLDMMDVFNSYSVNLWAVEKSEIRLTVQELMAITPVTNLTQMEKFYLQISDVDLYPENEPLIDTLLQSLATKSIVHVEEKSGGTQFKLIITYADGDQALFKPMRFDREKETEPNHFYFVDFERHVSEIAAFHLDRILGFRRCPPVVGRRLNITSEIYAVADDELLKTFFISPANNICFHGQCSYYCDTSHALCGGPDTIEGSFAALLPPNTICQRKSWKNPWRRSYHKRRKAEWETNNTYCEKVRRKPLYDQSKRLADVVDMSILDFLIGNMDRHHYETFQMFDNDSYIIHLDHGRGFGKSNIDEMSILAPLYQCCFINFKTFKRLLQLQVGPRSLATEMRCSLSKDPLKPVLLEKHLQALNRRLEIVLNMIKDCLKMHNTADVFFHGDTTELVHEYGTK